jgi:hypothetical protein
MDKITEYEIFCDARKNMNYYKGEILPFVNKLCRKNMTSGDIDGFVWDYGKKVYILIEQKWSKEAHKRSQDLHLEFMNAIFNECSKSDRFYEYKFYVFKIIGDPPFYKCRVCNIGTKETKHIDQEGLIDLLDIKILFEDLPQIV